MKLNQFWQASGEKMCFALREARTAFEIPSQLCKNIASERLGFQENWTPALIFVLATQLINKHQEPKIVTVKYLKAMECEAKIQLMLNLRRQEKC